MYAGLAPVKAVLTGRENQIVRDWAHYDMNMWIQTLVVGIVVVAVLVWWGFAMFRVHTDGMTFRSALVPRRLRYRRLVRDVQRNQQ